jgi:hypothetical protein
MRVIYVAFSFEVGDQYWSSDWAWGLPLIVLTVLIHVFGLMVIKQTVDRASSRTTRRIHPTAVFVVVMGCTTLLVTSLHAVEATIWAAAYLFLGALPDSRHAMLYSLNAITSYGHTNLRLEDHWHLMGALEALNGWLLFGLTTAFLFAIIQKALVSEWVPVSGRQQGAPRSPSSVHPI